MDRRCFRAVSRLRRRPLQGVLRAVVRRSQGAARRVLCHARVPHTQYVPELLHPGAPGRVRGFPNVRAMSAQPRRITWAENPRYRALVKLHQSSRERRKTGRSLLDGVHLVAAYLQHAGAPLEIVVSTSALDKDEIAAIVQ